MWWNGTICNGGSWRAAQSTCLSAVAVHAVTYRYVSYPVVTCLRRGDNVILALDDAHEPALDKIHLASRRSASMGLVRVSSGALVAASLSAEAGLCRNPAVV
eukprot:3828278-Prymnesium_polylepis.2